MAVYATGTAGYSYCFTCGNYCVLFGNEIRGIKDETIMYLRKINKNTISLKYYMVK